MRPQVTWCVYHFLAGKELVTTIMTPGLQSAEQGVRGHHWDVWSGCHVVSSVGSGCSSRLHHASLIGLEGSASSLGLCLVPFQVSPWSAIDVFHETAKSIDRFIYFILFHSHPFDQNSVVCWSSKVGEKDLKRGRAYNENTDTYNLASGESGGPPALHGRRTKWVFQPTLLLAEVTWDY